MAGVESNYWHQVALWRREMLQIGDSTSQLQILQMLKMLQIGGHSLRERVANWRRRILRWPHRLSQGRLAHCDRLRDGRTSTSAHCSDAVCAFCAHAPTLHCPTVTGDNATSIGGGLASKHQNIFLFKSAPERWDTGIVRPICLDRAQILSHNALAHNARGSISHGVCLHIAFCPPSHHCCGRKRCTNLVSTLSQSHLSSQVLGKASLRKRWQKLQH